MNIGMKRGIVYLENHDPEWEGIAHSTIDTLHNILGKDADDIQHVGSTAIRSIKAKPIIDIAVGVADYDAVLRKNTELEHHHLIFRFDERPVQLLYVMGDFIKDTRTHHIHVVTMHSAEWVKYINFRDYLNADEHAAREYEKCKIELAQRFSNDRSAYVNGKANIISKLLQEAAAWRNRQKNISVR